VCQRHPKPHNVVEAVANESILDSDQLPPVPDRAVGALSLALHHARNKRREPGYSTQLTQMIQIAFTRREKTLEFRAGSDSR
jgi:hypothetical protein